MNNSRRREIVQFLQSSAYTPCCATDTLLQSLLNDKDSCPSSSASERQSEQQQPIEVLDLTQHRATVGLQISVQVVGRLVGIVYGTGIYSDDSDINTAAVHAGLVSVGESKMVNIITKGPQKRRQPSPQQP
jgi:hypothetical protein